MQLIKHPFRLLRNLFYHLLAVTLFAIIYHRYGTFTSRTSEETQLSPLDSLYFSLTTQTTIGYGDIAPLDNKTKYMVIGQMFLLLVLVIGLRDLFFVSSFLF